MTNESRTVYHDSQLNIEAYRFKGVMQKFPNHFHDYYVIGFIEKGKRHLICNQQEYLLDVGDMTIFNPGEPHTCEQVDGKPMDYRCLNIKPEVMQRVIHDILGKETLPRFSPTVDFHSEMVDSLREIHEMISDDQRDLKKEEAFFLFIEQLIREHSDTVQATFLPQADATITKVSDYLQAYYNKPISLNELSTLVGLSKYHLIRTFTRQMGISPYNYLETIRIVKAKSLLENGMPVMEVAFQTGFNDQSHFTNYFKKQIGLTPKQYSKIFKDEAKQQPSKDQEV
jgi:AraC-like DNA-binding protein